MNEEIKKIPIILGTLGIGLLNILFDLCFLHHPSGWLVFDSIFWIVVLLSAIGGAGRNEPRSSGNKPQHIRDDPRIISELGKHRGPFWNKPSATYLENNAQPYSVAQSRIVLMLLLAPFGALAYLFLH